MQSDFEEIYKTYWPKIFRLCMGYVNEHSQAQDLAQETFIIVWQQLPKFRNESNIGTWIFRIATNNCLRQIEKNNRFPKSELPVELKDDHQEVELVLSEVEGPKIQFLYKCINELPEMERIIISLELEDIRQSEIANITGLTEANVRVKIHRIKERLTKKFKEHGQF